MKYIVALARSDIGSVSFGSLDNREAGLWKWQEGEKVSGLLGTDSVRAAAFSPDGRFIAIGDDDGHVSIHETHSGKRYRSLAGHMGAVRRVIFRPRGEYLLSASADQTAKLWDVFSGQQVAHLLGHRSPILAAAFEPTGRFVLTAAAGGRTRLWDIVGSHPERVITVCKWVGEDGPTRSTKTSGSAFCQAARQPLKRGLPWGPSSIGIYRQGNAAMT